MIRAAERAGVVLVVGHTASSNPAILKMRQLVAADDVGQLAMISATAYTDFLYRPRRPEELVTAVGGGIVYNQIPHQVDAARFVAGGLARTVRASAWSLDPTAAGANQPGGARRALRAAHSPHEETALRVHSGYAAGAQRPSESLLQAELGVFIVTCANADLRLAPDGVTVYGDDGVHVIAPESGSKLGGRGAVLDELYSAVAGERPVVHDGPWAKATMEVSLAMLQSALEQREIELHQQVPTRDSPSLTRR
jgi:phthalate 4,5-cis-dihydrodiol dehydrogenase